MEQESQFTRDDLPLRRAVICCTALLPELRIQVAELARRLGAKHEQDLRSDVTHLIVGSSATDKYKYVAKTRPDIRVLHHNFLEAVREDWTKGEDSFDLHALEEKHRLPTFFGLKICLTGFEDQALRNRVQKEVESGGGAYDGDLTKSVTHLIAAAPSGAKYTHAQQWGLNIVSYKWLEDSLERGMVLDEKYYDLNLPPGKQGQDAYKPEIEKRPASKLGKRPRESQTASSADADEGKRKLRRTASTRLSSHSQGLLQHLSTHETLVDDTVHDQWDDTSAAPTAPFRPETPNEQPDPITRCDAPGLMLSGIYVLLCHFNDARIERLRQHLGPNGAVVVDSAEQLETADLNPDFQRRYIIVPHARPRGVVNFPEATNTQIVTEWWLERCIMQRRHVDPGDSPLNRPLWHLNDSALGGLTIVSSGFEDVRMVVEAIRMMGGSYGEKLMDSTSIFVSGSPNLNPAKATWASKHRIPTVNANWLWECLRSGSKQPLDHFLLRLPEYNSGQPCSADASESTPQPTAPLPKTSNGLFKTAGRSSTTQTQRLSNKRTRNTPSLAVQSVKPDKPQPKPVELPFVHEDDAEGGEDGVEVNPSFDHDIAADVPIPSLEPAVPLTERSPNVSPRRRGSCAQGDDKLEPGENSKFRERGATADVKTPGIEEQPNPKRGEELAAELTSLLQNQRSGGSEPPSTKRKARPLGRALSGTFQNQRSSSLHSDGEPSKTNPRDPDASELDAGVFNPPRPVELPPSTQIGYENPEAEAHRLQIEKRMKISLAEPSAGTRLASVGMVKDSDLGQRTATVTRGAKSRKKG